MNKNNSSSAALKKVILFIIWPFGAFLESFVTPKKKGSMLIIFLFGLMFSWSMIYDNAENIDLSAIVDRFYNQPNWTFKELISNIKLVLSGESHEKDIYNIIINWLTRSISDNYHLMYLIASIPIMYFMVKSIKLLLNTRSFDNSKILILFLFLFILPKDFFSIQNFRFATASWIFIYSIIHFAEIGDKRKLSLLLITPLIHASFVFVLLVTLGFFFVRKKVGFVKILFFVSIPFAFITTELFSIESLSFLPHNLSNWSQGYYSDEILSVYGVNRTGTGNFWINLLFDYFRLSCYLIGSIILIRNSNTNNSENNNKLLVYYLFFLSITNFVQVIPVLGSRFWGLSRILFIYLWAKNMYPKANRFIYLLLASCTFEILYEGYNHYSIIVNSNFYYSPLIILISNFIGINNI